MLSAHGCVVNKKHWYSVNSQGKQLPKKTKYSPNGQVIDDCTHPTFSYSYPIGEWARANFQVTDYLTTSIMISQCYPSVYTIYHSQLPLAKVHSYFSFNSLTIDELRLGWRQATSSTEKEVSMATL